MSVQVIEMPAQKPRRESYRTLDGALLTARRVLRLSAWTVLAVALVIESLLLFRLWVQVTSQDAASGLTHFFYNLSGRLVEPFATFEVDQPIRNTGIVDLSTLLALEVYLVAAICAVSVLIFTNVLLRLVAVYRGWTVRRNAPRALDLEDAITGAVTERSR
jgi:uncharacterized protein YggT (Ycf19 family)